MPLGKIYKYEPKNNKPKKKPRAYKNCNTSEYTITTLEELRLNEKKKLSDILKEMYKRDNLGFGKHKDLKFIQMPRYYLKWIIKEKPQLIPTPKPWAEYAFSD